MTTLNFGRRQFLRMGLLGGIGTLTSCGSISGIPFLRATKETLPLEYLKTLPRPWRFKPLKPFSERDPFNTDHLRGSDLIALGDGWLNSFPSGGIKSIGVEEFLPRFDYQARSFLSGFGSDLFDCVLPIGVSPWVMLFRNGDPWLSQARQGWQVLFCFTKKDWPSSN